jgi:hypothetical protein
LVQDRSEGSHVRSDRAAARGSAPPRGAFGRA